MTDDDVVAYLVGDSGARPPGADTARVERTRALLGEPDLWAEPSPDLESRVVAAVLAAGRRPAADLGPTANLGPAADPDPATAPTAPTATKADAPEPVSLEERRASRRRFGRSLLGAAAAVVLLLGIGAVVLTHRDRPVQFAAALRGTPLAPAAKGSVTMTRTTSGWRVHLQASGLPRLDGGRYYQGWLKDAAGRLVPIGTFNQPDDVTLWSGVPPSAFPTLTITRQDAASGPASSGQKVLVGITHRTH